MKVSERRCWASRITHKGGKVTECYDRIDHDGKRRYDALRKLTRKEVVGLERQVMAVLFGPGANGNEDDRARVETLFRLRPGQVAEPNARGRRHRWRSKKRRTSAPQTMAPARANQCPSSCVIPKGG